MQRSQKGVASNQLVIILGAATVVFLLFGLWAFMGKQSATKDSDTKVAAAVALAKADTTKSVTAELQAADKSPTRTYKGSATYGSVTFDYPKAWSALVDTSAQPIDAYYYPDVLPALSSTTAFALRVELKATTYSDALGAFTSAVDSGDVKSVAYTPPKMVGVANSQPGVKLTGKIDGDFTGTMVILKVRDKTLFVYDQSTAFDADLNNTVLASLTFVP